MNKNLQEQKLQITHQKLLPGCEKVGNYFIGDPAYPLTPYCMREFSPCSSNAEVVFNNMVRSSCNPIECAFG